MARPRKNKTGVMPGFPKLAFYLGKDINIKVPQSHSYWNTKTYGLIPEELVVLVASCHYTDYSHRLAPRDPGQWWSEFKEVQGFHFVPVRALESGSPPITCIYSWRKSYKVLPKMDQSLFTIIEKDKNGEGLNQTAIAV